MEKIPLFWGRVKHLYKSSDVSNTQKLGSW